MQRTYSRKGIRRISRSALSSPERDDGPPPLLLPRKKRRIQVEVLAETSAAVSTTVDDDTSRGYQSDRIRNCEFLCSMDLNSVSAHLYLAAEDSRAFN
jgi:hypothetical protein